MLFAVHQPARYCVRRRSTWRAGVGDQGPSAGTAGHAATLLGVFAEYP